MLIHRRATWRQVVFLIRRTTLERIWRRLAVVLLLAMAVTVCHDIWPDRFLLLPVTPFTILGLALGIFLGFRNNASYDRYWEARKLWGQLVNECQSLTRQLLTVVGPTAAGDRGGDAPVAPEVQAELDLFRRAMVRRLAAFPYALKDHLRGGDDPRLGELLSPAELALLGSDRHRPLALLLWLGDGLRQASQRGWLHPFHRPLLEERLVGLTDVLGGCERIKNTPIPFSYSLLIHRVVGLYCLMLPLGLVDSLGNWTAPMVGMITYAFFGLDDIADEIQDPFGTDPNDLPLAAISRNIEILIRARIGETDLPQPFAPLDGVVI